MTGLFEHGHRGGLQWHPQRMYLGSNINDANAATSRRGLSGVGETTAKAIVAYRESSGRFASVGELLEVKGIGMAIPNANREMLHVN